MASITVQPEFLLERILTLEIVRVTERAAVSSAQAARARAGEGRRPGRRRRHAPRAEQIADRRHGGDRRGRDRRGADAVHRREGRQQDRARRSISRSIRWKAPRSAPRTCRAPSPPSPWPTAARCCTRPIATWTKSPSGPAIRKAPSTSTRRRKKTSSGWPRPRASSRRKSPPSCSTARATPTRSPRSASSAPRSA